MSSVSDLIEQMLLDMIKESDGSVEIKRNNLAGELNCVPSQINYVIQTRFTPERGYTIESRRGGGGSIRITRVKVGADGYLMHIVNSIGDSIDVRTADVFLKNLVANGIINEREARLMGSALSDKSIPSSSADIRNKVRAVVFKNMMLTLV